MESALPQPFEDQDGGRHGYIHGVNGASHGDLNQEAGFLHPQRAEACGLRSHDDGRWQSEVYPIVTPGASEGSSKDLDIFGFLKMQGFRT